MIEYKKQCPKCGNDMVYNGSCAPYNLKESIKNNTCCHKCAGVGINKGKIRSEETKRKLSLINKGKKKSPFTEEHKKNISISACKRSKNNKVKEWSLTLPSGKEIKVHGYERFAIPYLFNQGVTENDLICGVNSVNPISYYWNLGIHNYVPDMFIKSTNTIVEVKSEWTFFEYIEQNKAKAQATIEAGFNYRMIIFNQEHELVLDKEKHI